jgi:hypothetical protein
VIFRSEKPEKFLFSNNAAIGLGGVADASIRDEHTLRYSGKGISLTQDLIKVCDSAPCDFVLKQSGAPGCFCFDRERTK